VVATGERPVGEWYKRYVLNYTPEQRRKDLEQPPRTPAGRKRSSC
jgi:hypothetical protein